MLVTSIFSFSHNVFYPFQNKFQFFHENHFVVRSFNLFLCEILSFGIGGFMHLQKQSTPVSLHRAYKLTWVKTVIYINFLHVSGRFCLKIHFNSQKRVSNLGFVLAHTIDMVLVLFPGSRIERD